MCDQNVLPYFCTEKSRYFRVGDTSRSIFQELFSKNSTFRLYNRPAIDDAITSGKQLRFSHDPRKYHDCALEWEWNYIKNKLNIDDADKALRLKKDGFWYVTTK